MCLKIDWASLIGLALFLYLRAISKYKPPGGAYIWRGDLTEGFLSYEFRGLIFRGAYTWRGLFSEFYGRLHAFVKIMQDVLNISTLGHFSFCQQVEYSGGFSSFNIRRFGQQFVDRVANPKDILHFYQRKKPPTKTGNLTTVPGGGYFLIRG